MLTFTQRANNLEQHAEHVNSLYKSLLIRYGGDSNRFSEEVIDKMVYAASKVADYDTRVKQLSQNLGANNILSTQQALADIVNGSTSREATQNALKEINELVTDPQGNTVTSDKKDELKTDLRDLIELALRRKEFLKEYEDIKKDPLSFQGAALPKRVESVEVEQQEGKGKKAVVSTTPLNTGQTYSLVDPIRREGNKIILAPKITVQDATLGGEVQTTLPNGETTYVPTQDFRNFKISPVSNESQEVAEAFVKSVNKVMGKTQFTPFRKAFEDVDKSSPEAIQEFVNSTDDKALADAIVKEMKPIIKAMQEKREQERKAAEKLAKDEATRKALEEQIRKNESSSDVLPVDIISEEDLTDEEKDYPKAPIESFLSKEADYYDPKAPKPHQKRRLVFLNNLSKIWGSQEAAAIKVMAITQKNEEQYGLKGFYDWVVNDIKNSNLSPEQRAKYFDEKGNIREDQKPIIKLYIGQKAGKKYLIDDYGTPVVELKGNVLEQVINLGVFGTFHSSLTGSYEFGANAGRDNFSGSIEDLPAVQNQFEKWRARTQEATEAPTYDIQGVSRGIVLRDQEDKPVTQTALVSESELSKEGLLRVPVYPEQITINNISYKLPVGRPILVNGSNVDFLNSRTFTPQEAENIFKLFRAASENVGSAESQRIIDYLSSVLYMKSTPAESQAKITLDSAGNWNFGTNLKVPFTTFSFDNNKAPILGYLSSYFVKVNNKKLVPGQFEEAYINTRGEVSFKTHPSYQQYMLTGSTPFLRSRALRQLSTEDPTIISRYTTLADNEFAFETSVAPQAPQETDEPDSTEVGEIVEEIDPFAGKSPFAKKEKKEETAKAPSKLFGKRKPPTPEERAAIEAEAKKKRDAQNSKPLDLGEFRIENPVAEYKPMDIQKELTFIQNKTPFYVQILDNLIQTTDGIFAWGMYKDMLISLYDKAQQGTGYHEVFEGIWKHFTTDDEAYKIIKEFRQRSGNFTYYDGSTYYSIPYSNATEKQIKETLADEFADYIISQEKPKSFSIARWFQNLWNLIKSIFAGQTQYVDNLFANINAGKYKSMSYNPTSPSEDAEYKLADLNYQQQYDTIRGVAVQVIQEMLKPDKENSVSITEWEESEVDTESFYQDVYNRLEDIYTDKIYNPQMKLTPELQKAYREYWEGLKEDWDTVKKLTTEYLKTYSIVEDIKKRENENYDYRDDSKYFQNDAKNTASRSIRLLIATLPETIFNRDSGKIESRRNSTFMQEQVNYAKTFNGLLAQLTNINSYQEKLSKLEELGKKQPNFARLYQRLTAKSNAKNPASVLNDWKLKVRFFNVFSKQTPSVYIQFNQPNGTSFTGIRNSDSSIKSITQGWVDSLKNLAIAGTSDVAYQDEDGKMFIDTKAVTGVDTAKPEGKIRFLNLLTIPFTMDMFNSLNVQQQSAFNEAVTSLKAQLKTQGTYPLRDVQAWQSTGNMDSLALAFIQAGNDFESIYQNLEGENQTKSVSTNKISRDVNDLNNASSIQDLYSVLPHLQQVKDSVYLNDILFKDGKRNRGFNIDMGFIQGTMDSRGNPLPGENLAEHERLVQEINQNLNERYYVLVPADSKTQWLLTLRNLVSYKDIATGARDWQTRFVEKFTEYYNTEKNSYIQKQRRGIPVEKRAGIFKELSNNYQMNDVDFAFAVNDYIDTLTSSQRRLLENYRVLKSTGKEKNIWNWEGLDGKFVSREQLNHEKLTSEQVDNILKFRTVNYMMNNVEMQKIFFGDILEYKDPTKRYKLFLSPREVSIHGVPEYNNYLNEWGNKVGNIKLDHPYLGQHSFSDNITTVTMGDVFAFNQDLAKVDKAYELINTTDASAISTIVGMRERRLKGGNWTEKDEEQYQYMQARDRQLLLKDGYLNENNYPKKLQKHDESLVNQGNPNISYVYVEKPIASGHTEIDNEFTPVVDKFSIVSYSYAAIRDTNLRPHYLKMLKQDVGYLIVNSGRKVGARTADTFYDQEGNVNRDPYKSVVKIPFSAYGVQTDTSSKKEQQTRGTQVTKLVILNLFNAGKPISEEAGNLANENISLLREQVNIGYAKLLKQIGATDVNGEFRIEDKSKILSLVKNELLRREVADTIKQQLQLTEDNQLQTAFEALPNYQQIKNILYSYVDKNITSPKVNGAPMVQVSGALMEKYGVKRRKVNDKYVYYSEALKFYTKEEPWIEVMMPFWAAKKLRQAGLKWDTEDELYNILSKSPDGDKILRGIGFRIPTQELNSIENFKIKGFLPEEMGDTIVVPEEITTKAGSDFDIDKLNTYLQNIYVDAKKQPRIIPYFGIGEKAKEKLSRWYAEEQVAKWLTQALDDDFNPNEEAGEDPIEKIYRYSIENKYFENMRDLLSLPENFTRLVVPNTADTLKGIRDKLVEIAPFEFSDGDITSIINPLYMLINRHRGQSVKKLVGIAALAQTGTAIAQLSNIYLDPEYIKSLSGNYRAFIGSDPSVKLPHNQVDGRISISAIKDQDDIYISDKISQYINGTVDVFNDAFLAQINFNRKTAGIYLMLERIGVPNSEKHPVVSFFMNQPIIREFVKFSNVRRVNNLLNSKLIADFRSQVINDKFKTSFYEKAEELPESISSLSDLLEDNIKKAYNGIDFTKKDNATQVMLFNEFLKYAVYSSQLFNLQQGTNFDTANLNDNYALYMKEIATGKAERFNIWRSASSILSSTFIGDQREALLNSTATLSDVLVVNNPTTQKYLAKMLSKVSEFLPMEERMYIARQMEESLINYLIQTGTSINNSINHMLVNQQTALVNELREVKKKLKQSDNPNLINSNLILKQLIPYIKGDRVNGTKNITLAVKPRDVFSKNLYNASFKELLYNPVTEKLARSLVKLSFIQSGISNSYVSFKDAIPADTYSKIVMSAMPQITNEETLNNFVETGAFYRNQASNDNVVRQISNDFYTIFEEDGGLASPIFKPFLDFVKLQKQLGKMPQEAATPYTLWYDSWRDDPFVAHTSYFEVGGEEFTRKILFRRVEDSNGQAIIRNVLSNDDPSSPDATTSAALYVQVNAWGDNFTQEYYDSAKPSQLKTQFASVPYELDNNALFQYIEFGIHPDVKIGEENPSSDDQSTQDKLDECL